MEILTDITLRDKNTFKIGGIARYYTEPHNSYEIVEALKFAKEHSLKIFVLGKGSNVLISDFGFSGLVINIADNLTGTTWDGDILEANGGVLLNMVVNQAIEKGWAGIEELAGIPGTVGGAVIMNAGAFNTCIADTLHSVQYFEFSTSKLITRNASEIDLKYRSSALYGTEVIITAAKFKFSRQDSVHYLREIKADIMSRRRLKQPLEYPNCGSVFKRPPGNYAGTLIEQCGLKGMGVGGVEVSTKHANFIVNKGAGTASDVRRLIIKIQKTVFEQFGILLEPEVIFVGEYEDALFKS